MTGSPLESAPRSLPVEHRAHVRIPALDGVRGIAILLVMFFHFFQMRGGTNFIGVHMSILSHLGVDLFFVLSGFLITGILLDSKHKPNVLRNFYIRRILRIFPLYYLTLLFLFIILPAHWCNGP